MNYELYSLRPFISYFYAAATKKQIKTTFFFYNKINYHKLIF